MNGIEHLGLCFGWFVLVCFAILLLAGVAAAVFSGINFVAGLGEDRAAARKYAQVAACLQTAVADRGHKDPSEAVMDALCRANQWDRAVREGCVLEWIKYDPLVKASHSDRGYYLVELEAHNCPRVAVRKCGGFFDENDKEFRGVYRFAKLSGRPDGAEGGV